MAGDTQDTTQAHWLDCCGFKHLFRAFSMAISPSRLGIAFCGLLALYVVGRLLDVATFDNHKPVVVVADGMSTTELDIFIGHNGDKTATLKEIEDYRTRKVTLKTNGTFETILQQSRVITNRLTDAALHADLRGVIDAVIYSGRMKLWVFRMHTLFALIFMAAGLAIWAIVGGALCRLTALEIARDERIGPMEAVKFAREKFWSFFSAPLFPAGALLLGILALCVPGLIGLIPWLGEIVVGIFLIIALLIGFVMALVIIGSAGAGWLMHPTIAVEGSDAFDAISRSFGYLMARPWRTIGYLLVSLVYGAICLTFVKILVRLTLACTHAGLGLLMNVDYVKTTAGPNEVGKLDAMWQAPSLDFVSNPFYGTFVGDPASNTQLVAHYIIQAWVYGMATLVGAFAVSFAYSSFTIIYFLLRRDVDATGFEDVYVEDFGPTAPAAAPAPAPAKSGTSLPIIGQP